MNEWLGFSTFACLVVDLGIGRGFGHMVVMLHPTSFVSFLKQISSVVWLIL